MSYSRSSKSADGPPKKYELYRGLRSPAWINPKTNKIVRAAYHLRETEKDGLSVGIVTEWQSRHDFRANGPLDPCYGVLGLSTRNFDNLGLAVKAKKKSKELALVNSSYPNKNTEQERADAVADMLINDSVIIVAPSETHKKSHKELQDK